MDNATLTKAIAEAHKPLVEAFGRIERQVRALSCAELARTLYSPEELRELRDRGQSLFAADAQAFDKMGKAYSEVEEKTGSHSWEERVKLYGETVARAQRAPSDQAHEARKATLDALSEFEAAHPLVYELLQHAQSRKA